VSATGEDPKAEGEGDVHYSVTGQRGRKKKGKCTNPRGCLSDGEESI